MSLLIKALDKAQAEKKAQVEEAKSAKSKKTEKATQKKESKKAKSSKAKKKTKQSKKSKVTKSEKAIKEESLDLTLSPPKDDIVTKKPAPKPSLPEVLADSAAAKKIEKKAVPLSIAPIEQAPKKPVKKSGLQTSATTTRRTPNVIVPPAEIDAEAGIAETLKQPVKKTVQAAPANVAPAKPTVNKPVETAQAVQATQTASSERAANVFAAKQTEKVMHKNSVLPMIAGAALIAMVAMLFYYYQFIDHSPEVVIPPRPVTQIQSVQKTSPAPAENMAEQELLAVAEESEGLSQIENNDALESIAQESMTENEMSSESAQVSAEVAALEQAPAQSIFANNTQTTNVENTLTASEQAVEVAGRAIDSETVEQSKPVRLDKVVISESASIEVTKNKSESKISPLLTRAYEAYSAGNDAVARESYKEVLRNDGLNVDAMLGLAAIATRQGRNADAKDWYQKVLGVEPRNATAQSGVLFIQQQNSGPAEESKIKSMLVQSPNDANLHAALGNLYVDKNEWAAAQQAYFEAYRLNQSAENAYNLGISLDQLNKPKLALPYYQEALAKVATSNSVTIDQAGLQARIAAINGF